MKQLTSADGAHSISMRWLTIHNSSCSRRAFHRSLNPFIHFRFLAESGMSTTKRRQRVPIHHAALTPMAFDLLRFVADRAEVIYDLQHRLRQPLARHFTPVIELKRKQYLESPLSAAHRSSFL